MSSVEIEGKSFNYIKLSNKEELPESKGIYVIACERDDKYTILDVGMTYDQTLKERVANHDRKDCWDKNCSHVLMIAYLVMENSTKEEILDLESKIRTSRNLKCGER